MGWFHLNSRDKMQIRIKIGNKYVIYIAYAAMIALAIFTIWPIWWLLMSSLKTTQDLSGNPWGLPRELDFSNYYNAWVNSGLTRNIINSMVVTAISIAVTLICSSTIAYVVSRMNFKGRGALYYFFIAGMMVPVHSLVIPLYLNTLSWGMQNNLLVLGLVYGAFRIPFSVFILEGYLAGIPKEMEECATIDGCSVWGCFLRIIIPLTRDGMITIGILAMMSAWNELLVSTLLIKRPELKTLTVGLRGFVSDVQNEQTQLFAGLFIACLPSLIVYAFASDKMIKGMTMGAVKG